MVAGEFLLEKKEAGKLASFNVDNALKQIDMGDTRVVYSTTQDFGLKEVRLNLLIEHLMNKGRGDIAFYRKLKW